MSSVKYDSRTAAKLSKSWDSNLPPPSVLSPLELFPSKHDTVAKAFFPVKPPSTHKIESSQQWLFTDRIHPNFGISGNSQDTQIKRAYRRIESNGLFTPANIKDVSLGDISPRASTKRKYIVVEESRLQELTRFEAMLRKEKELIGEQCTWVLNDFQFDARFPLPATRNAVHNLCEQQMKKLRNDIASLQASWNEFCLANHYNKPHLFIKDSYVKCAPLSQKALKLRLAKEATENWRLRKDRDCMLFEDDLSYLTGKYVEALTRDKDYERYYILATRYGVLSEQEYNLDPRPGKRYYQRVMKGALKFQLLWDRYWATTKLRRFRAARNIQKYARRMIVFKKLHPIIRMRLKIGKKTYYIYCFALWKHYIKLCRMIKDALNFYFSSYKQICFLSWKQFLKDIKNDRERILQRMIARNKSGGVYGKFVRWQYFVREQKALKRRLRRLFGFPHFDIWHRYTKWSKYLKHINAKATILQAGVRCFIEKRRLRRKKRAQIQLKYFVMMVCATRLVRFKRQHVIRAEFEEWCPEEQMRRAVRLNDMEKQRLFRRQQIMTEKEKVALKDLKRHFKTGDGKIQLKETVLTISSNMNTYLSGKTLKFSLQESSLLQGLSEKIKSSKSPALMSSKNQGNNASFRGLSPERPDRGDDTTAAAAAGGSGSAATPLGSLGRQMSRALSFRGDNAADVETAAVAEGGGIASGRESPAPPPPLTRGVSTRDIPSEVQTILVSSTATTKAFKDMTPAEKTVFARKLICGQCSDLARNIERHNYDSKFPPFIRCPDINCQATFISEVQYHNHMFVSTKHQTISAAARAAYTTTSTAVVEIMPQGKLSIDTAAAPAAGAPALALTKGKRKNYDPVNDFSHFHLMLRHHKGHELLRTYLVKLYGMSGVINSFDCYSAVLEWRKCLTGNSNYHTKAMSIYELFLMPDSTRRLDFIDEVTNIDLVLDKLDTFKKRTSNAMYETKHAHKNMFREFLHLEGKSYLEWTDRNVLNPSIFNNLEHECFFHMFEVVQLDPLFKDSAEYAAYRKIVASEEQHKQDELMKDYLTYRTGVIKAWVHSYKLVETALFNKAEEIMEVFVNKELDRLVTKALKHEIKKKAFEIRCVEQAKHESDMLLMDDALFFAEENILEYVFDFYSRSMLDTMWEMPELRKGMMEYAGFIKPTLKKKLLIDMNVKNDANDWFKDFFKKVSTQDAESVPLTKDESAVIIQKRMRGVLGRNKMRKIFVKNYIKRLDPASGCHYYCNIKEGTSSWERPKFIVHIYPNSNW